MKCTPVRCTICAHKMTHIRYTPHETHARGMDAYEMHAHEVYPREMHAHGTCVCEVHVHEVNPHEMHAHKMHARKVYT